LYHQRATHGVVIYLLEMHFVSFHYWDLAVVYAEERGVCAWPETERGGRAKQQQQQLR